MELDNRTEHLLKLIRAGDHERAARDLAAMRVQDTAYLLMELEDDHVARVFGALPGDRRPDVFSYLDDHYQIILLEALSDREKQAILSRIDPDDLTDLLEELPQAQVRALLRLLPFRAIRRALILLGYPEDSVGRLMTPDYLAVRGDLTIAEATAQIREQVDRYETVNVIFVVDGEKRLINVIPIKRLILGRPEDPVASLIKDDSPVVAIGATAEREEAVRLIQHYDLAVLPVVDEEGHLLGIVTVDDVLDVVQEEATEDFHKMGSVGLVNLSLRDARPSLLYRKRVGWLLILVFMNIFGGAAIAHFEDAIEALVVLVFFLPLVIDSGGNAGSQAATLMVRALAIGDVHARDWLKLWGKELGVAIALGITMGIAVSVLGVWRGGTEIGIVVAIAMTLVVVVGSMVGMLLPFVLTRMKLDPATASAPLITSIADIAGIIIYFTTATILLDIPIGT